MITRETKITIWDRDGQLKTDTIENLLCETGIHVSDEQLSELDCYVECSVSRYYDDWDTLAEGKVKNLLAHSNVEVREWLANHGYALYFLVNDPETSVRQAVACRGYGITILAHDSHEQVRRELAYYGFAWDILVHDTDKHTRLAIANYPNRYDVKMDEEDIARYESALAVLIHDEYAEVRKAIAHYGYGLNELVTDDNADVVLEVMKHGVVNADLVHHADKRVRAEMARLGHGIETLIHDLDETVRHAAISFLLDEINSQNQFTEVKRNELLNSVQDDKSWDVQMLLLKHGYRNEAFIQKVINSKHLQSIRVLIELGIGLDELLTHPSPEVRSALAKAGYRLDILIDDPNKSVRFTAQHHMGKKFDA